MPKINLSVGQHCPTCGTPAIQGKNGAYCKSCYIAWKNNQQSTKPTPMVQPFITPTEREQKIEKMHDEKQESIAISVAKNNATTIMAQRQPAELKDLMLEWDILVEHFYNYFIK